MARPSKLTPAVQDRIVAAIRAGNYAEPAARSAGVSPATYHRWMARGEKEPSGIYRDFYEAVRKAEADAEVEAVARVRRAMPDDWRASMTYLERRYPERWRRRDSHEHTGAGGGPVRISEAMFKDDETRKALREALRRAGRACTDKPRRPGPDD
jgi:transposase